MGASVVVAVVVVWALTVWEGDLEGLCGVSEVPHGQAAIRVAAHELLAFVMPAH